jgi:hypothetical protein
MISGVGGRGIEEDSASKILWICRANSRLTVNSLPSEQITCGRCGGLLAKANLARWRLVCDREYLAPRNSGVVQGAMQ